MFSGKFGRRTLTSLSMVIAILVLAAPAFAQTGRVQGKVVDDQGKAVEGAQITVSAVPDTGGQKWEAKTDKNGNYEFSGIQAGEYTVVTYSTKGVPTTTFYPGVDDSSKAKPVKLSQSAVVQRIDFKLLP